MAEFEPQRAGSEKIAAIKSRIRTLGRLPFINKSGVGLALVIAIIVQNY